MVAFYPGPAGATESELPLDAWDADRRGQPAARRAAARRRGAADPRRGPATAASSPATSCRSTPATSWSAGCACSGAASTAAREAHEAMDEFFAAVAAQSRPAPEAAAGRPMTTLVFTVARHRRRAVRGRPAADRPAADRGDHRRSRSTPSRCAARSGSSRSAAATTPAEEAGLRGLFGDREPLARHAATRSCGCSATPWCRASPGTTEVDLALPCTYDFEVTGSKYLHALRRRRRAARPAVLRHGLHPGQQRVSAVEQVAVGLRGGLRTCRSRSGSR